MYVRHFHKKAVYAHNYSFFWKGQFNYQMYGSNAGLFEEYLFWVGQYEPPLFLKLRVGKTKPKLT